MTAIRVNTTVNTGALITLWIEDCPTCGVIYGFNAAYEERRRADGKSWHCPNGHSISFGKSNTDRLREAEAREVHLKDQLAAATRNEEAARSELLRVRSRIANGVCPCCRRSFDNVRRHMATQHPDFAAPDVAHSAVKFECSGGARFDTYHGLRIHQGKARPSDWDRQPVRSWRAHLTVV